MACLAVRIRSSKVQTCWEFSACIQPQPGHVRAAKHLVQEQPPTATAALRPGPCLELGDTFVSKVALSAQQFVSQPHRLGPQAVVKAAATQYAPPPLSVSLMGGGGKLV